jgi:antitoxin component YwqK of YwqJK toxin-antitoxin module
MKGVAILTLVLLSSCASIEDEVISRWENGNPQVIHQKNPTYDNSYLYISLNEEGDTVNKGRIENEVQIGEWKWWYDNGSLKDIAYLENGLYMNKRVHFHENGDTSKIEVIDTPCAGTCCPGKLVYFKDNSRLLIKPQNEKGVIEGTCFQLNANGDTTAIFKYQNDNQEGLRMEFEDNGQLAAVGDFENGLEQGDWIIYDELGNPSAVDKYIKGQITESRDHVTNSTSVEPYKTSESKLLYYESIEKSR